jgi:hypothetical protein
MTKLYAVLMKAYLNEDSQRGGIKSNVGMGEQLRQLADQFVHLTATIEQRELCSL